MNFESLSNGTVNNVRDRDIWLGEFADTKMRIIRLKSKDTQMRGKSISFRNKKTSSQSFLNVQ